VGISTKEISEVIKERLKDFDASLVATDVGRIVATSDGIAQIYGLQNAMAGELLEFPHDTFGLALNLEEDQVRAVILGEYGHLHEGDEVRTTGRLLEVPVGEELIGRVVNPLGVPIDGKGPIKTTKTMPVEKIAPGVITRKRVDSPVQTGIKAIDTMIPIGRGQRELIIGDRFTGKTTVLLDTILNQKGKDLICVYVAIGQNAASIARVAATLEERGAMEYTIIVAASASDPASLNFIAPYAGCAMGEYFMEQGKEALCCYDDLTKQAWAYRELSLNLRRPPGREAYPGDVFYLHSRLLERAAKMSDAKGGGSLTALPVIETQANDVSAFIPTNVISITDGQIYLQSDLFNAGQRPALNVGISVSRVGGDAQTKAMRQVAGQLRLDLAQYRELAAFAQFASDLDTATRNQLERGARLTELLKQDKYKPVPLGEQVAAIYAGTQGYLDKVPTAKVREWEAGFTRFLKSERPAVLAEIEEKKALDDSLFERLKAAISTYNHQFGVEGYSDVADPAGGAAESTTKPPQAEAKKPAPKAQAPTAKAEPKAPAPAKAETAPPSTKAEHEERPSQLNEIRAAIADSPPKSKPAPKKPKKEQ
jgi:F-type H+-transporting ATPase subunit alpha